MKTLLTIFAVLALTACGGQESPIDHKEDWEIDVELCEAQDGIVDINHITNPTTGGYYIEVGCLVVGEPVYAD